MKIYNGNAIWIDTSWDFWGSAFQMMIFILQTSSGAIQVLRNADGGGGGGVSDFLEKSVTKV